jgi:three-Cys-motif partner protein
VERVPSTRSIERGGLRVLAAKHPSASWNIQPHTEAKHRLLSAYLKAWFPILSLGGFERVIYVDGFAGPGRYTGGQEGSPLIALRALATQRLQLQSTFEFHFVERRRRVVQALEANLAELRQAGEIPANAEIYVHAEKTFQVAFDQAIRPKLAQFPRAPAFALVDPFGWTGIPMEIIASLVARPSTEVFVNFMFEEINRFLGHLDQPENFDRLFGGVEWRKCKELSGNFRKRCLHDYYRDRLQVKASARYVRSFEMRNERDLADYFLFFATKNVRGLEKMKEAMWRVDPSGGFSFSDATNPNQVTLFGDEPDRVLLRKLLKQAFGAQKTSVGKIEQFVVEETPFLPSHYKKVLKAMEDEGEITVIGASTGRRAGTYPDKQMAIQFQ